MGDEDLLDFDEFEAMLAGFSRTCQRCGWLSQSKTEFVVSARFALRFIKATVKTYVGSRSEISFGAEPASIATLFLP